MMTITIENLNFGFNERLIFRNFSLQLGKNDAEESPIVLLGPSGCGKTTLLRLICGLLRFESGKIAIHSENTAPANGTEAEKREEDQKISFVFQEPRLLPSLSVLENVMLPITKLMQKKQAQERARHFLHLSSMDEYAAAMPEQLSGGQKQRVSIARAWAYPAPLILMDEPFQSLDIPLRIQLMDAVQTLMDAENRFVIAVTHDPREALYFGKRIIVLGSDTAAGTGVVLDETLTLPKESRHFVSEKLIATEERLIAALS